MDLEQSIRDGSRTETIGFFTLMDLETCNDQHEPETRRSSNLTRWVCLALVLPARVLTQQPDASVVRQSLYDAWWTGPILANSAATLPRGHILIEPYIYDVLSANASSFGSLTYMLYGLTDRFTVGLVPTAGLTKPNAGTSSSGIELGDASILGQYRLTQFREGHWLPTMSLQVQETLPTGRYDQLGSRPSNGLGGGDFSTTLALNTQAYLWTRTGRIARMRLNVSETVSTIARVAGVSVYGTTEAFKGSANPGKAFFADMAWEYNLTRKWVLALDLTYRHSGRTIRNRKQRRFSPDL